MLLVFNKFKQVLANFDMKFRPISKKNTQMKHYQQ